VILYCYVKLYFQLMVLFFLMTNNVFIMLMFIIFVGLFYFHNVFDLMDVLIVYSSIYLLICYLFILFISYLIYVI